MNYFTIFIYIDILLVLAIIGYTIFHFFFDTKLRVFIIKPNKQITIYRLKIINDTITIKDKVTNTNKTYTINRDFIYYKFGRIPYTFFWDNIPIPLDLQEDNNINLDKKEITVLNKIYSKLGIQININKPTSQLKKNINIDTAETFFRILHTNFTLNLLKPPKEFKEAIKWMMIFITIGVIIATILHFTGVINLGEILGTTTS